MRHRPERAHHCSTCGQCILRHDRHDWLTGTCIGFRNHKFYLLFLFYGALASTVFLLSVAPHFFVRVVVASHVAGSATVATLALSLTAVRILEASILMVAFLALPYFYYNLTVQCSQICRNITTHEASYVATNPYDLGTRLANAAAVFGTDFGPLFLYWLLPLDPCRPESDGLFYPLPSSPESAGHGSVEDGKNADDSIEALLGAPFGNNKRIEK
ncbi:zinc finger protein DHHC domain containing protein, putative [Perkinsus marinus ATCC 50983]|uniref:Palmitoyltransferase n=1 Tax=Perkinsus marinus (strain ATCC 50983 / TXsc) TaxID=423536 RepID=C5KXT4_PERM5|nr:zinc finger protein DHHC domain containing protein, putative [Perkinsus marinus ATCC 50983]EER10808.1 zinc finger protein DHHC domain containing protein, putative [Perkinsus marinus ATCC 50983]|eukprot:XP_002779013.1 zinc finger protein DHHC domain containing protein, putative [Perkinsus marinus ATCC 50983]